MKNLILIILCLPILLFGQEKTKKVYIDSNYNVKLLSISYYGELIFHSGYRFQFDQPIKSKVKEVHKPRLLFPNKEKYKMRRRTVYKGINFTHFKHKEHSSTYQISLHRQWRRSKQNGLYRGLQFGYGLQMVYNASPTYKVRNNGELKRVYLAQNTYFVTPIAIELGYDFSQKMKKDLQVFTRYNGNILWGYNAFIYPQLAFEIGVKFAR